MTNKSKETALYVDSFGIENILQDVLNKIKDKAITCNILSFKIINLLCVGFILSLSQNICLQEKRC